MTKREAFKMFLKPGFKEEYRRRHAAIFPELKQLLSDTGVRNYSIYLDDSLSASRLIDAALFHPDRYRQPEDSDYSQGRQIIWDIWPGLAKFVRYSELTQNECKQHLPRVAPQLPVVNSFHFLYL